MGGFILGLLAGIAYNTDAGRKIAGRVERAAKDIMNAALTPAKGDGSDDEQQEDR